MLSELDSGLWERLAYPSQRRSGGLGGVPAPRGDLPAAISAADPVELARVSYELTQGIAQGSIGGIPLRLHFTQTLPALFGDRHNAAQKAVAEFLRTPHALGVDMLGLRRGRSVIEAFGEFLLQRADTQELRLTARHEMLAGLIKTLTRAPEPGFVIADPDVHRTGRVSWVAVADRSALTLDPLRRPRDPVVFASTGERYAGGGVGAAVLCALLHGVTRCVPWFADVDPADIEQARSALRRRGLVA